MKIPIPAEVAEAMDEMRQNLADIKKLLEQLLVLQRAQLPILSKDEQLRMIALGRIEGGERDG